MSWDIRSRHQSLHEEKRGVNMEVRQWLGLDNRYRDHNRCEPIVRVFHIRNNPLGWTDIWGGGESSFQKPLPWNSQNVVHTFATTDHLEVNCRYPHATKTKIIPWTPSKNFQKQSTVTCAWRWNVITFQNIATQFLPLGCRSIFRFDMWLSLTQAGVVVVITRVGSHSHVSSFISATVIFGCRKSRKVAEIGRLPPI